ncbi:hypothetical protein F5883DRAFT_578954 [Diaporthe sp. PMI_573]|nr:hypothetical protein F5883DRAFT_578954 [Diaporthaceae sp. PMI_573]
MTTNLQRPTMGIDDTFDTSRTSASSTRNESPDASITLTAQTKQGEGSMSKANGQGPHSVPPRYATRAAQRSLGHGAPTPQLDPCSPPGSLNDPPLKPQPCLRCLMACVKDGKVTCSGPATRSIGKKIACEGCAKRRNRANQYPKHLRRLPWSFGTSEIVPFIFAKDDQEAQRTAAPRTTGHTPSSRKGTTAKLICDHKPSFAGRPACTEHQGGHRESGTTTETMTG